MRALRFLLGGLLLLVAGCGPRIPPGYREALRRPEQFDHDFLLRQRLVFRRGEVVGTLETALQRRGPTLTFIGLTPFGTRAFVLQQRGSEVSFTSYLPEGELLFPPRYILLDLQRTLLPVLSRDPLSDGTHRDRRGEMEVTEIWRDGRLRERRFRPISGRSAGELVITYPGEGYGFGEAPGRLELHNGWVGYELILTPLAYQRLEDPTGADGR